MFRMPYGRRAVAFGIGAVLALAVAARAEAPSTSPPVRLTAEITWKSPPLPTLPGPAGAADEASGATAVELEMTAGRVLGAVAWPEPASGGPEELSDGGRWRLGTARHGRVRVRVEAPITASLIVRAGPQATAFPIAELAGGPRQTAPGVAIPVHVARLSWDALEVSLAPGPGADSPIGADGTVVPGSTVPVRIAFNVLTAEPSDGLARLTVELHTAGDDAEPIWRYDQTHVVASNPASGSAPCLILNVPAPRREGTYGLSIESSWEPAAPAKSSRIGRLIQRHRSSGPGPVATSRELTLAVLGPPLPGALAKAQVKPPPATTAPGTVVETIDLARVRGPRPSATGRAPAPLPGRTAWNVPGEALVEVAFRDRLRGWMPWGADAALLPPADESGLPWAALGLKVPHPGLPHRLTLSVTGGEPSALGVALVVPGGDPRVLLDSCATGPAVADGSTPLSFSWSLWPGASDLVLVLVNRGGQSVRLGSVTLEELEDPPAPAALAESHSGTPRHLGLALNGPEDLGRYGPGHDTIAIGRNLAAYLAHCGASAVALPEDLGPDGASRLALDGQAVEDVLGPQRLGLLLRLLAEHQVEAVIELRGDGPLPGLPPADSPEALRRGVVRVDGRGQADGPSYSPLHPDVRAAMAERVRRAIAVRQDHPNVIGLLVRLGAGATLPGHPDTGLDDGTFGRFVRAMLDPRAARAVPGQDLSDPLRFAARRRYLGGPGRAPWLAWRAREVGELYAGLAREVTTTAPGATLIVATPTLDDGPAGRQARLADASGESPLQAWKAVGLDLDQWPLPAEGLVVLRAVGPATEPLSQELATHSELDAPVARRPARGMFLAGAEPPERPPSTLVLAAAPPGTADEPLGHALAALDAQWVLLSATAVSGREASVGQFARVFRALPAAAEPLARPLAPESGVAARAWSAGGLTFLGLANDTPYTIRLDALLRGPADAAIKDLGRDLRLEPRTVSGGRSLVLDLPPFGASAIRIAGTDTRAETVALYPLNDAVEAEYRQLSARLDRLAQGLVTTGPPNAGFEPAAPQAGVVTEIGSSRAATSPGWTVSEGASAMIDPAGPRSGEGSLRLEAKAAGASVAGEPFAPPGGAEMEVRVWLRAERPDTPVRIWVEGQSRGKPITRRAEIKAQAGWTEQRIRVSALPAGGLESMRLRFELSAPGQLWIDDLAVVGQRPSEPDLRAQRVLVKARQAFRERRIADFARLANSHWARSAAAVPPAAASASASTVRTGRATDLPRERRLR
jgi:hypothetical protein